MTVTDIVELSKTRSKIIIDNEAAFVLYKGEIRSMDIKKGRELSDECYFHIMNELLVKRAKLRCLNLLKSRDYTRHQLERKLKQGFYPQTVMEAAIAYVASYGYLDDVKYAVSYIKYAGTTKSNKQIINDLQVKGVSKQDIETAFAQCEEKNILANEEELIQKLLEKKRYQKTEASFAERQKIALFLYRKGFSSDKINKAVGLYE